MRKSVNNFFGTLHQRYLKPYGFKKVRHTFSRENADYTERFQFQGSAWNDSASPWRFYINVGVEFHNIPARVPCRDFPRTHCWTRIERLVSDVPSEYELPESNTEEFASQIAGYLESASLHVAREIQQIRQAYEYNKTPYLSTA
jgi:Domain of unknown function (DUF4304)